MTPAGDARPTKNGSGKKWPSSSPTFSLSETGFGGGFCPSSWVKKLCRRPSCFHFRGALGPPDGGGAITAGVQGTQSHTAASAAPIYCFHLLAFIFASHITGQTACQQHPRPGRPGHKTGSHFPLLPEGLRLTSKAGGAAWRRAGPGRAEMI